MALARDPKFQRAKREVVGGTILAFLLVRSRNFVSLPLKLLGEVFM